MSFNYNTEEAMKSIAEAAAKRFNNDLKAKILEQIDPMINEIIADITKDIETRAYKLLDRMIDSVVVQYIDRRPKETKE